MDAKIVAGWLNLGAAGAALVAAGLWGYSTWVSKPYVEHTVDGWTSGGVVEDDGRGRLTDPFASAKAQALWNRWAALAAAVAAGLQGIALLIAP